ncbi:MAG TPA: MFS transporter [Gemmataceae bacterium]|nr:MFS transporter [Gemmataceae bacterium]
MGTRANRPLLKPTGVRFGVLTFVCVLSLLTYIDRVCISQAQRDIQFELRISDVGLGLVLGAFAVGYGLLEAPAGGLGDRWGARRVLTGIVLFWSLFAALTGAADYLVGWTPGFDLATSATTVLVTLVTVRFLFGCGEAGAYPNISRVVNDWFPFRERGAAQGAVWMSARLGGAVSFVVLGALTTWLGWRQAFLLLGLAGAAWCVAFFWWFRDSPEQAPQCNEAERDKIRDGAKPAATHAHAWPPLRPMATSMTLWGLCIAALGVNAGWWFLPAYQPKYLDEVYHVTSGADAVAGKGATLAGLAASPLGQGPLLTAAASAPAPPQHKINLLAMLLPGLPFAAGAAGCLAGGRLSDWLVQRLRSKRWGRSLVGIAGFGGAGLCVLVAGFMRNVYQFYALLCVASFINDLAVPIIWQASADVGGRYVGVVSGIMNSVGAIGAFLTMLLTPVVLSSLPAGLDVTERWRIVFAGYAGCWFIAAAGWLLVNAGKPMFPEPVRGPNADVPLS